MSDLERRRQPEVERRSAVSELRGGEEAGTIVGYAAVFDSVSEDLGGFREIVRRTAFDRAIAEKTDVVARAHHNSEHLLGTVAAGTLKLTVDDHGLRYEVQMPNTTAGRDVLEYIRRGDIRHSSFAFITPEGGDKWEGRSVDGLPMRELLDVQLVDVAPVVGPAYKATVVGKRALEAAAPVDIPAPPAPGVPNEINEARQRLSGEGLMDMIKRTVMAILVAALMVGPASAATVEVLQGQPNVPGVVLSSAQTGNADSTNTLDRGALRGPALLKITSTVGATPTVTVDIMGSADGVNFYNVAYAAAATPETAAVGALTITTAVTSYYVLRPSHPWRYLKLVYSANTNVTLTADVYQSR